MFHKFIWKSSQYPHWLMMVYEHWNKTESVFKRIIHYMRVCPVSRSSNMLHVKWEFY